MTMKSILHSINSRFWSKVDIMDDRTECWEWNAGTSSNGYGSFGYEGKTPSSHTVAYRLTKGIIPSGYIVSHRCDNKLCVNPNHLVATTSKYNNIDCIKKKRNVSANGLKTHCKHGHEFTEENTRYSNGERVCRACARARDRTRRNSDKRREDMRRYQQAWRQRQKDARNE
jgi:hypothetical protein